MPLTAVALLPLLVVAVLENAWISAAAAQREVVPGRWTAAEPDRGVVVSLTIAASSTLVLPGTGSSGRVEALTLTVRHLQQQQRSATFSVDLPDDEGVVDFEFQVDSTGDIGVLTARRIDGEPVEDDAAAWTLRRQRQQ